MALGRALRACHAMRPAMPVAQLILVPYLLTALCGDSRWYIMSAVLVQSRVGNGYGLADKPAKNIL